MIDIVTVVFREELPVLKLQAESIELYCNNMNLGNIYVIVNDEDLDASEINLGWWGKFSSQVVVMHRRTWGNEYVNNGWLTQQLLKLLGSAHSSNIWTMVLDAKTILVQPVDVKRLFDDSGRLTWGYYPIMPVFSRAQEIVSKLFEIEQKDVAGPAGVPFFFHNPTVKEMIPEVESRSKQNFNQWFQDQGMVTEFILYSGYIQYRDGSLDKVYKKNYSRPYGCCNIAHFEVGNFDEKYLSMSDNNNLTVSIHRVAWEQLTAIQKESYRIFLISKGITGAKELI